MSSPRRAELAERIMNLRGSLAAAASEQDRFALALQVERLEAELAAELAGSQPVPPGGHFAASGSVAQPFREPCR
jgi:hypothetical protein